MKRLLKGLLHFCAENAVGGCDESFVHVHDGFPLLLLLLPLTFFPSREQQILIKKDNMSFLS
jgi:hypothetical protein